MLSIASGARHSSPPAAIIPGLAHSGKVTRFAEIRPADGTGAVRIHPVRVTPDGRVIAFSVGREMSRLYRYKGLK